MTTLFILNASFVSAQYYQDTSVYTNYTDGYGYTNTGYNPYQTTYNTQYQDNRLNYWYPNQYQNNYYVQPVQTSYQYTQGCNTYKYDAYTRLTTLVSSTCYLNNTYQNNYQYTYPTNQYSTYRYVNGVWVYGNGNTSSGCNQNNYYGYGYNNTYNTCNHNTNGCYWQNGYQVCY